MPHGAPPGGGATGEGRPCETMPEGVSVGLCLVDAASWREAQRSLRESEARRAAREAEYRLIADHASDVIWKLDLRTFRFSYISPSITRLRGLTVDEALAEPVEQSLTPESFARVLELMGKVLARAPAGQAEEHRDIYDQPCRDGSVKHVEITTNVVRDANGEAVEVVGVSRDATARVEAERALRRSEACFRALIERSTDMTAVLDASLNTTFWSPSSTEGLGWEREEIVGRPMLETELVHPDDLDSARAAVEAVLGVPGATSLTVTRNRHKDGSWRLVECKLRNLLDDPGVGGIVLNARDITEQHRLEEELAQAQKLESLGRLAGGVAHDFNNLLTVVLGCAASLQEDLAQGAPLHAGDLEAIRTAAERGRDLTRQLLGFARRQVIAPVPLDLAQHARTGERIARRMLHEEVALQVEAEPGLWPVRFDPGQLDQVLLNLFANARDAIPRGGEVVVRMRNVRAPEAGAVTVGEAPPPGDWVSLAVRDTGSGMTPEVKAHLFEPFFTTKPKGKGSGLGLATVYGIVRQNGGLVRVESEPGQGTTVEILLPRSADPPAPAEGPATARAAGEPHGAGASILVVEDDPLVRDVTVSALTGAGFEVLVGSGGEEGLELARSRTQPLDLVVTDVVMPGLSGRDVADRLRAERPELPVLFVSGYPQDVIARRGVLDDGVELLPKPFTPAELVERVRTLLAPQERRR